MITHSSVLAGKIPWTEEPGGYSPWGCKGFDTIEHRQTKYKLLTRISKYRSKAKILYLPT